MTDSVPEKPGKYKIIEEVGRGGLPIWGWVLIALMAALVIGAAILLAVQGGKLALLPPAPPGMVYV
ncbi:MAG: hypothetical protein GTN71_25765, partial [Anaerolineae bacterium]|nr:hypothetical protein [Anaerolineae bacterium]